MNANAAITIDSLRKSYANFTLDIPALAINRGYITGFIGENGAGKTTTLRLIMDAITPDGGTVTVLGGDPRADPSGIIGRVGFVENMSCFHPSFRVRQVEQLLAPFFPKWDRELFAAYCRRFKLDPGTKVKELSSGRSKLLSLTAALSHRPELLILDEPTTNLDPVVRSEILELFAELMQDGNTTILYSTHITSDLDKTADYIVYIHDGRILLDEEKDRLLSGYCIVKGGNGLLEEKGEAGLMGLRKSGVGFSALAKREYAEKTFGGAAVYERPNVEDIMVRLGKDSRNGAGPEFS